jgi:redox-sensitive bicupin YhaK (pirin superfamily)
MTAGRGILHQEMPKGDAKGRMHGFQLWGNLPRALKMTAPRYQDMEASALPERHEDDGTSIRVVIGDYRGVKSPVDGIAADPQYLDVYVPAGKRKTFKVDTRRRAFAYVFEGAANFRDAARPEGVLLEKEVKGKEVNIRDLSGNRTLVRFGAGDEVTVTAGPDGVRFLLISGAPIEEPVAWAGPIVMNSEAELRQAFTELRNGTFIRPAH